MIGPSRPPVASAETALHRYAYTGSDTKPFHYKQPPTFVRMLYGIAVLTMLAGFGLIAFGLFVWLRNEAVFNGIFFSVVGIGTVWISAIPGSMYHDSVALQDIRQMFSHTGGRR